MKLPIDQRSAIANQVLTYLWPVQYWSREEQMFAMAEGWCLSVFDPEDMDRIQRWDYQNGQCTDFATDAEAALYVLQRAREGSPLHCRAIVLHAAAVMKRGG